MAGRALAALLALAGLAGGAAIVLTAPRSEPVKPGPGRAEIAELRAEIDGKLRECAAGVHGRATTIAELPWLQQAVATDAATLRDLSDGERARAFRSKPGETIVIAQIKPGRDPEVLFRNAGGNGPLPPLGRSGFHLVGSPAGLVLAEVVDVKPSERADELRGAIALSWPVDLSRAMARSAELGAGARLIYEGGELALSPAPPAAGEGEEVVLPLESEPGRGARVTALLPPPPPPPPAALPRQLAGAGVALLGLLAAGLLARRRGAAAIATSPAPSTVPAAVPGSTTGVGHAGDTALGVPPGAGSSASLAAPRTSGLMTDAALAPASPDVFAQTSLYAGSKPALAAAEVAPEGPRRIGRYLVVRELGSGGMADVLLARSTGEAGFEKLVALKVLQSHMARQKMVVEHFLDEARLASRLVHQNIVQIYDLGRAGEDYFIAMEYVEGSDLERLIARARERGEPIPLRVAFTVVARMLDGLHAAHTALSAEGKPLEIVHRDVKAANVFVARNGAVKVGDFGIAKANEEARGARTEIGQVKGTAAYMSPEHRIGERLDARADVYSAAAVAYEVFTGQEINLDLVRIAHLGQQGWPHLAPPTRLRPDLPPELDVTLFRALAYDRQTRPESCAALAEELEAIAARAGIGLSDKAVAQWMAGDSPSDPSLVPSRGPTAT